MKTLLLSCLLCLFALPALAQSAPPPHATITHVPVHEALAGELALRFTVQHPELAGEIEVHVLPDRTHVEEQVVVALRDDQGYVAALPAARVQPPGFSYFVTEHMPDGSQRAVFADATWPHRVRVTLPKEVEDEHQRLALRDGQRSSVVLAADGVDYGDRTVSPGQAPLRDRYYRIEAGYAYGFLSRVESIRLTLVRVRGESAQLVVGRAGPQSVLTGIDCGRAEVTLLATEEVRARAALLLGASQRGFEYGVGSALVLGDPQGMNLDLGLEHITTLGTTGHLRMGFLAHERVPMGASVEVSSFPAGHDAGVRLLYDIGYRFGPVTQLSLRGGYQGRTSVSGGPSLGASFEYGF